VKLITRDTDYALRAICFIAQQKKRVVSVTTLVRELKIPRPFLRKILQALNKKRILKSHKGHGGGFILGVKPANIFLVDLIRIFQGQLSLNECFLRKMRCPNMDKCALRKKIKRIERYVARELEPINIASLIK